MLKRREKAHRCPWCDEYWPPTPDNTPTAHMSYTLHVFGAHRDQPRPDIRCREAHEGLVPDPPKIVLQYPGDAFPRRLPRETHCFTCGTPLESGIDPVCDVCGWLICECQSCGCEYYGFGG